MPKSEKVDVDPRAPQAFDAPVEGRTPGCTAPVARPTLPGRQEDWIRRPPERLVRLTEAVGPKTPWRDADAAVGAAMRGELEVWVPCTDLRCWLGRFPVQISELFGQLECEDLAQLLRDGRATIQRITVTRGAATLVEPVEVTVSSLFIMVQPDSTPVMPEGRTPAPRVAKSRARPRTRKKRGETADALIESTGEEVPPAAVEVAPIVRTTRTTRTKAETPPSAERSSAEVRAPEVKTATQPSADAPSTTVSAPPGRRQEVPGRVLRQAEVCALTGLSRTTIWRLETRGDFPRRRKLGRQAVGWMEDEVRAWVDARALGGPGAGERAGSEGR